MYLFRYSQGVFSVIFSKVSGKQEDEENTKKQVYVQTSF